MNKGLLIFIVILIVIGTYGCNKYNGMVGADEGVNKAWANVQKEYQRRMDAIKNLVETVKGAANFEQETLQKVIEARAKATSITIDPSKATPAQMQQFQESQSGLNSALSRLLVTIEQYPQLKANENFLRLQDEIAGTENRIASARSDYNTEIEKFNVRIRTFPNNIFANILGFQRRNPFEADVEAQNAPKVDFETKK